MNSGFVGVKLTTVGDIHSLVTENGLHSGVRQRVKLGGVDDYNTLYYPTNVTERTGHFRTSFNFS